MIEWNSKPADGKGTPKMAKPLKNCQCSPFCEDQTRSSFAPGHDARMVKRLTWLVAADQISVLDASDAIREAGGTERLVDKLIRSVGRLSVRWNRICDTTVYSHNDALVIWYVGHRASRGEAPWVMFQRRKGMGDDVDHFIKRWPEEYPTFWSLAEAVEWQAAQGKSTKSRWWVWEYRGDWK